MRKCERGASTHQSLFWWSKATRAFHTRNVLRLLFCRAERVRTIGTTLYIRDNNMGYFSNHRDIPIFFIVLNFRENTILMLHLMGVRNVVCGGVRVVSTDRQTMGVIVTSNGPSAVYCIRNKYYYIR